MLSNEALKIIAKCKKCYGTGRVGYDKDNRPILCKCAIRVARELREHRELGRVL